MVAMPNRMRLVVVMSALALAAGLLTLALLAKPTQAQAETATVNERFPVAFEIENPCTGEVVFIEGTLHSVFHITRDADGGFHIKGHNNFQAQGVSPSGAKYVVHESANRQLNFRDESADNFTFLVTLEAIRQGSATPEDDFKVKALIHITANANGELTAEVVKIRGECK